MPDTNHTNPTTTSTKADTHALRQQLAKAICGGEAHMKAADVFKGVPPKHWGAQVAGAPHTLWQLLEHIRFTLHDLYVFSTSPDYTAPSWPEDYWPKNISPANAKEAETAVHRLADAQESMIRLVESAQTDLYAEIPWGDGQTILREALLAATHTSYHLGQAMFLRKQLEATAS